MRNRIKAEMVRRGLCGSELAEVLGITPTALSNKMNGKNDFTASELLRLSELFGLSVDYFLKGGELYDSGTHHS